MATGEGGQHGCPEFIPTIFASVSFAPIRRASGSVAPDKIGGHQSWILEPRRERVRAPVGETSHLTIDRLQDLLAAESIAVCRDTIWPFLRREGPRFKKASPS